jgi:acyl-coenzyme A thioesterase PaaI-like protein
MAVIAEWIAAQAVTEMHFPGSEHSFVSGSAANRPIQVTYRKCAAADVLGSALEPSLRSLFAEGEPLTKKTVLLAELVFTQLCQGPPLHAHGGSVAAALDELMGGAGWLNGFPVLARRIEVDFVKPVKIGVRHFGFAAITQKDGRKLFLTGAVINSHGQILSHARGLFIKLAEHQMQSLVEN